MKKSFTHLAAKFGSVILVTSVLFAAHSSQAFIFIRGGSYAKGARPVSDAPIWPSRHVRFEVNTNLATYGGSLSPDVTGGEFLQAAQDAINAWATACRADLTVEFVGVSSRKKDASDNTNTIVYDNRTTGEGNDFGGSTSILAAANSAVAGREFFDCDIVVNGNSSATFRVDGTDADLVSILTHEIGHCLGLDHPIESLAATPYTAPGTQAAPASLLWEATMVQSADVPTGNSPISRRDLDQDDIDAIECVYERGKPFGGGSSCGSYHGTNGGSAISGVQNGGPTATESPKLCSTDGDANTARTNPNDDGTGCIPAAVASPGGSSGSGNPVHLLGSVWSFLLLIAGIYFVRRALGKKKPSPFVLLLFATFLISAAVSRDASAKPFDLELSYRRFGSDLFDRFSGLNTSNGATWDSGPEQGKIEKFLEPTLRYQGWDKSWGQTGFSATLTLPSSAESSGTPQGLSAVRKETSIWGYRFGPSARIYLSKSPGLFLDGVIGFGQFLTNQTISGSAHGELAALAYSFEAGLALGYEWKPSEDYSIFAKIGYSRLTSSFFSAQSSSGDFADFVPGTRVAVTGPGGNEDLRMNATGVAFTIGMRFEAGKRRSKWSRLPEKSAEAAPDETAREPEPTPSSTPSSTPEPEATPSPAPSPAVPHEFDLDKNPELRVNPAPSPLPSVVPSVIPAPQPAPVPTRRGIDQPPAFDDAPDTTDLAPPAPVIVPEIPARSAPVPVPTAAPAPIPAPPPSGPGIDPMPELEETPRGLYPERPGREEYRSMED